jgi:hypothetical protein
VRKLWSAEALAVCAFLALGAAPAQADPRGWAVLGRSLGLGPDGRAPIDVTRPTARQLEMFGGGLPLLGGLGGRPPVNAAPRTPDRSGMPPGDLPPATATPAPMARPTAPSTVDDPRLHEEPVDGEVSHTRDFTSEGRPIAGVDPQYQ